MTISRRTVLGSALAAAAVTRPAVTRAAAAARADTLRIVPSSALTVLDPVWTPAGVTTGHAYHVFDTLFAVDRAMNVRPQMAEAIETADDGRTATIRLREGLRFHDGTPVLPRDCIASITRWARRDSFGSLLGRAADGMDAPDDRTIRIRYKTPFRRTADALAHPVALGCFIMPERLAATDPQKQVTEMVGSGPYRFLPDEFVAGSRVAYARFDGYTPRPEPADYASGGKRAGFARIEWQVIPDPATATAALARGEVDWLEYAPADLVPSLRRTPGVRVVDSDPFYAAMRFNCLQPPFDNPRLRHAVLTAVDQTDYMQSISSPDEHAWNTCFAMLGCGQPHVTEVGAPLMAPPRNLDAARAAVAASGYDNEKVVVLNPTDLPAVTPHGALTADLLRRLGMNVDLQEMDWGTLNARRISREPTARNGWSIFHINTPGVAIGNPALDFFIRGQGANGGFFGWYDSPAMETAAAAWLDTTSPQAEQDVFDRVQAIAFADAPIVPLGTFAMRTAHRADLQGLIPASVLFPWNVRRT